MFYKIIFEEDLLRKNQELIINVSNSTAFIVYVFFTFIKTHIFVSFYSWGMERGGEILHICITLCILADFQT